jgi:cellobiose phosphorylase
MGTIRKFNLKGFNGFYFPLFNKTGLMSYITPTLSGDIKLDYHHYLTEPFSEKDLVNSLFSRNVIFTIDGKAYHLNGNTALQQNDKIDLEVGPLYQIVTRKNRNHTLQTTSFIVNDEPIELHQVVFTNLKEQPVKLHVLTASPLYGRSADNLRDHRHVTSLLNRVWVKDHLIELKPTLSFDERGHKPNDVFYGFHTKSADMSIAAYYPSLDEFIGNGNLLFPKPRRASMVGDYIEGYEAMGGVSFEPVVVEPGASITLYMGFSASYKDDLSSLNRFLTTAHFDKAFEASKAYWLDEVSRLQFSYSNQAKTDLLDMVAIQPILRRFFGNSYMPHHDYGKGGKGWRDLWQDFLSLIMYNDPTVKESLINNFAGIRIDGSNATIIGSKKGEFKADRNNIVRVWSDHGAWPLVTTLMYIHETGDLDFLWKNTPYFDDQFTHYTKQTKENFPKDYILRVQNQAYEGSIFEHLLLENVVAALNIGEQGFIKLEDADWNDGLDMATKRGETLAFTHFYANNLRQLGEILELSNKAEIPLFKSLAELSLNAHKSADLDKFFNEVSQFNGEVVLVNTEKLAKSLKAKAKSMIKHLEAYGVHPNGALQSYIDNDGVFLDRKDTLSLTGQAMALLSETVSKSRATKIAIETKKQLFDSAIGGYKLNSNFNEVKLNMGRAYGFAYGHKENGAVFSHMAVMYAYGLYQYDLVKYGHQAINALMNRAIHKDANMLAGIPEYFTPKGEGKYSYLTGSASWLLKLLRTEVYGIQMHLGTLTLNPKLMKSDFIEGQVTIETYLFGQKRRITYRNPKGLEYGQYEIRSIHMNQRLVPNYFVELEGDLEVLLDERY